MPTVADVLKMNGTALKDSGLTNVLDEAPFVALLPCHVATDGTFNKFWREIKAPVVGFRAANTGNKNQTSEEEEVIQALKILDFSFFKDKAVVDAAVTILPDGTTVKGRDEYMDKEWARHIRSGLSRFEKQLFVGGDALGFTPIIQAIPEDMIVDIKGTAENAATTVFLVRMPDDYTGLGAVAGSDGDITGGDYNLQKIPIMKNAEMTYMDAYNMASAAYMGVQISTSKCLGRIKNITKEPGKTLTDAMIAEAVALFPAEKQPTHIVMSRTAQFMLQQSRTATSPTGQQAPIPTESFGIPIVVTSNIPDTMAVA